MAPGGFVGPNGEVADKEGYVLICQHTARRIVRVGKDLQIRPLVERYQGKRFNSRTISSIVPTGRCISRILLTGWRNRTKTQPKSFRLMASTG